MIRQAAGPADWAAARTLIEEYIDWLPFELDFQDHEAELKDLAAHYVAPRGAVFLAMDGEQRAIGVVGVRPIDAETAELKRMYVRPAGRGRGLGRDLAAAAISFATAAGYRTVRLDSDEESMPAANQLYEDIGFVDIARYREYPLRCARFMELKL